LIYDRCRSLGIVEQLDLIAPPHDWSTPLAREADEQSAQGGAEDVTLMGLPGQEDDQGV